jgi:hypothetical protein
MVAALLDVERQRGKRPLRQDLVWRINRLGVCALDNPVRIAAVDEVFAAFTPPDFSFRPDFGVCAINDDNGGAITIGGELHSRIGKAADLQRTIWPWAGIASHDYLRATDDYRGSGLALVVLTQSFQFFDRLGLKSVVVQAGLETGTYYWARYGFDFIEDSEREEVRSWAKAVLDALAEAIDIDNLASAYQFATIGKKEDKRASFEDIAERLGPDDERATVRGFFRQVASRNNLGYDEQIDLGKAIMLSYPLTWSGYMDLDINASQRQLFELHARTRIRKLAQQL